MHCYHVHERGCGLNYMGTVNALVGNILLRTATTAMKEAVAYPTWVQCMQFSSNLWTMDRNISSR